LSTTATGQSPKLALITGSTSGIGLGIAHALAGAGMNIVLNGLGEADKIDALRAELAAQYKVEVFYDGANMMAPEEIAAMIARYENIDVLVNNAGIQHVAPIEAFPPEKWDQIIAINLNSAFHTIRASIASMAKRGHGQRQY
jgi:3-hydroxybutyrate dehydrogenase